MAGDRPSLTPVETFQAEWELNLLLEVVERLAPINILEVGAMWGGTLWHWIRMSYYVTVVDDEMRNAELWRAWAADWSANLELLHGSSQEQLTIKQAARNAPYDFAFIDGAHDYVSVKADWDNYGPMCAVVAFHDILPRPGYGVAQLWSELTAMPGARYLEICQNETLPGNEGPCGIGVLWT